MDPEQTEIRGITPSYWGPCAWAMIHYVSLGYPKSPTNAHKQQYKAFFETLGNVLPCLKCRNNFKRHMTHAPPNLESKDDLFAWTVRLHNIVNGELEKRRIDIRAARAMYDMGMHCSCAPRGSPAVDTATCILILAIVVATSSLLMS